MDGPSDNPDDPLGCQRVRTSQTLDVIFPYGIDVLLRLHDGQHRHRQVGRSHSERGDGTGRVRGKIDEDEIGPAYSASTRGVKLPRANDLTPGLPQVRLDDVPVAVSLSSQKNPRSWTRCTGTPEFSSECSSTSREIGLTKG